MRDPGNIDAVCAARPDYLGFIFYPKSKRYVGDLPDEDIFSRVPNEIEKVGVFVNESPAGVVATCNRYKLQVAQLHGSETPEDCLTVKKAGLRVFKALAIDDAFDFGKLDVYVGSVDFFLFDTKGKLPGGTGEKFNWQVLENYQLPVPFFLSGGIGPDDYAALSKPIHEQLYAVDINSGFELEPALKDAGQVAAFINQIRN